MKNKRTWFTTRLSLTILVLLLIAIGGIYVYQNKPDTQPTVSAPVSTSTPASEAAPANKPDPSPSAYLASRTWFWIDTLRPAGQPKSESRDRSKFKLTFSNEKEGTFSASTDCNGIGGEYKIAGNKITFDKMMSTLMFCEGSQEAEYRKMLEQVVSFEIVTDSSPSELIFTLKDGSTMLYRQ